LGRSVHFRRLLPPDRLLPGAKFTLRPSLAFAYWQRYCTALQQRASAKLCVVVQRILECGPMPNVMAALPNIGGAVCESSVIPFLVPRHRVWLTPAAGVACSNAEYPSSVSIPSTTALAIATVARVSLRR